MLQRFSFHIASLPSYRLFPSSLIVLNHFPFAASDAVFPLWFIRQNTSTLFS